MPENEIAEVFEAPDREVGCQRGLHAFLSFDSQSDVCLLNHGHIIATVAHASNPLVCYRLDHLCYSLLLFRTATAHAYCLYVLRFLEEKVSQLLILADDAQNRSINHEHD